MNDLILLIIGFLITIIASIFSLIEKSNDNKGNKKSNKYNVLAFLVILAGIIVAFYSGTHSLSEKNKSERLKHTSDSIAQISQEKLQLKSDLIIQIQKENYLETKMLNDSLRNAKERIIMLQKEINNNIIGETSPCFIVFQTSGDKKGYTVLVNEGDLPILDLEIYITDFNELLKCKYSVRKEYIMFDEPCYNKCTKILSSLTVRSGPNNLKEFSLPSEKDEGSFEIRFFYKYNLEYLEQIMYWRDGNKIQCVGRLFKLTGYKYKFLKYVNSDNLKLRNNFDEVFKIPLISRAFAPIFWR